MLDLCELTLNVAAAACTMFAGCRMVQFTAAATTAAAADVIGVWMGK